MQIKKELTPKNTMCGNCCEQCPAIFETDNNSYLVIGKVVDANELGVEKRIGKDEVLVEIPKGLLKF